MKKYILLPMALLISFLCSGCGILHNWQDATCTTPKTCKWCHAEEGEALGHIWVEPTCTTAKTCQVCHATEGPPSGHDWIAADCLTAKTCAECGIVEGEPLGHTWVDATCTDPKTCTRCSLTEGEPGEHSMHCTYFGRSTYHTKCWYCDLETKNEPIRSWETFSQQLVQSRFPAMALISEKGSFELLSLQEDYIEFREDGTVTMVVRGVTYEGTWSFEKYRDTSDKLRHYAQYALDFGGEGEAQGFIPWDDPQHMQVQFGSHWSISFMQDENEQSRMRHLNKVL